MNFNAAAAEAVCCRGAFAPVIISHFTVPLVMGRCACLESCGEQVVESCGEQVTNGLQLLVWFAVVGRCASTGGAHPTRAPRPFRPPRKKSY